MSDTLKINFTLRVFSVMEEIFMYPELGKQLLEKTLEERVEFQRHFCKTGHSFQTSTFWSNGLRH